MLADLSRAYGVLESDPSVRAGVLYAQGDHFTAGLDLVDVGPGLASGELSFPDDGRDPWRLGCARPSPNSSPARTPPRVCNRSSNVGPPALSGASRKNAERAPPAGNRRQKSRHECTFDEP